MNALSQTILLEFGKFPSFLCGRLITLLLPQWKFNTINDIPPKKEGNDTIEI